MDKLKPHYGHGVSGDRFWPRPPLVKQILTGLERRESLCLFGPRRTGKSTLLRECARFTVIEVNGEGMDAVASLFDRIVPALPNDIRPNFDHEFFHQFDERFGEYGVAEQEASREMLRCIARSSRSSRSRSYDDLYDAVEGALGEEKTAAVDLSDLIRALEEDGFLSDRRDQDQIAFASRLVEAWWLTRDHRRKRRRG